MAGIIKKITARTEMSSYDIVVGSSFLPSAFAREEFSSSDGLAVVVSSRVNELYEEYIQKSCDEITQYEFFIMDDCEENKNYKYAERFLERFIEKGLNRKSAVIGIGGGVVGDFAGFISAVYMRGVSVIHVPTTLLAMVDSSIGGKVAVNLAVGKNIVGVFHQPKMVISDVKFLNTLPDDEFKNGLTEALKHGLLGDNSTLELMESNDLSSIREEKIISRLILLSVLFKTKIVERDEKESGLRSILNYGHTIGHAIESLTEYRGISHGEAVAAGIKVKTEISRRLGLLSEKEADRVCTIIDRYSLCKGAYDLDIDEVILHMNYDKKNFGSNINFVLLKGLGNPCFNQQIDENILRDVLTEFL